MDQHIDSLYRIAHVSPPSACTQALMLLFHLAVGSSSRSDVDEEISEDKKISKGDGNSVSSRKDRFYRVLYTKLGDPSMFFGRQQTLFFNLLYKAMKNDNKGIRVVAFGKRLLHVAFHHSPSVVSGALFLVSEVMKHQPLLQSGLHSTDGHGSIFDPLKREPSAALFQLKKKVRMRTQLIWHQLKQLACGKFL
jgi:ribosome biogenesis protein MAK21